MVHVLLKSLRVQREAKVRVEWDEIAWVAVCLAGLAYQIRNVRFLARAKALADLGQSSSRRIFAGVMLRSAWLRASSFAVFAAIGVVLWFEPPVGGEWDTPSVHMAWIQGALFVGLMVAAITCTALDRRDYVTIQHEVRNGSSSSR